MAPESPDTGLQTFRLLSAFSRQFGSLNAREKLSRMRIKALGVLGAGIAGFLQEPMLFGLWSF